MLGHQGGFFAFLLAQQPRNKRAGSNAGTSGNGDEKKMDRKGNGKGGETAFADAGDKKTVHHIVQGLYSHGDHSWDR